MNAINGAVTTLFDLALKPLELLGRELALILVSGVFGILALIVFKHISSQRGIKAAKDKIKGHMIAIRIYQDDLVVVVQSVGRVLARNAQYLGLNFGPFVPLAVPFVFVAAQMVTRYGFAPLPVVAPADVANVLPGGGTLIRVELAKGHEAAAVGLQLSLPEGVRAVSPLVRVPARGLAFQEVVATAAGVHELEFRLADGTRETKTLVAGDARAAMMQPERVRSFWLAMLWPAEAKFASDSPFTLIRLEYPESELGWLPGGPTGILIVFVLASMAFGFAMLKPLGVQI